MTDEHENLNRVDEEQIDEMDEQLEAVQSFTQNIVDQTVADLAAEAGRTPNHQWERMRDHFAYMAVEADPHQKQLDDYEVSGDTVEVEP